MKRFAIILLASVLWMPARLNASGLPERDCYLKFNRSYDVPGMTKNELYSYLAGWYKKVRPLEIGGGSLVGKNPRDIKSYSGLFENLDFGKTRGDLHVVIYLKLRDGGFDFEMTDISAYWNNRFVLFLYSIDDSFNRPLLWRIFHSRKVLDAARERAAEIFEELASSMDEYLKSGPPVEMSESG